MKLRKHFSIFVSILFSLLGLSIGVNKKAFNTNALVDPDGFNLVSIKLVDETKKWQPNDVVTFDDILGTWAYDPIHGPFNEQVISLIDLAEFSFTPMKVNQGKIDSTNQQTEFVLSKGDNQIRLYAYPDDAPSAYQWQELTISITDPIPTYPSVITSIIDAHLNEDNAYVMGDLIDSDDVWVKVSDGTYTYEGYANTFENDNIKFGFNASFSGSQYTYYPAIYLQKGVNNLDVCFLDTDVVDSDVHYALSYDTRILISIEAEIPSSKYYYIGDTFTAEGIMLYAHFGDGSTRIDNTGEGVICSQSVVYEGTNNVTLSYTDNGITKSTTITFKGYKKLSSITSTLVNEKTWNAGDKVMGSDFEIIPHYNDGTSGSAITDGTGVSISPSVLKAGTNNVVVSYYENGIRISASPITINASALATAEDVASAFNGALEGQKTESLAFSLKFASSPTNIPTGYSEAVSEWSSDIFSDGVISLNNIDIANSSDITICTQFASLVLAPSSLGNGVYSYHTEDSAFTFALQNENLSKISKVGFVVSMEMNEKYLDEDGFIPYYAYFSAITNDSEKIEINFSKESLDNEEVFVEVAPGTLKSVSYDIYCENHDFGSPIILREINFYYEENSDAACDFNGVNTDLDSIKSAWESAKNSYSSLTSEEKLKFNGAKVEQTDFSIDFCTNFSSQDIFRNRDDSNIFADPSIIAFSNEDSLTGWEYICVGDEYSGKNGGGLSLTNYNRGSYTQEIPINKSVGTVYTDKVNITFKNGTLNYVCLRLITYQGSYSYEFDDVEGSYDDYVEVEITLDQPSQIYNIWLESAGWDMDPDETTLAWVKKLDFISCHDVQPTGEILKMIEKYDYIYGKYGKQLDLDDFLNRKPVEFAYKNRFIKDKHQSSSIPVILAISIISISSIGVLLAFKKRKDN